MSHLQPRIHLHYLTYVAPGEKSLFRSLSFVFENKKIGLVGRNGIGKSTLIKLMMGELLPQEGTVQIEGSIAYCPQLIEETQQTVAELLGVQAKLMALQRIQQGSIDELDFQTLGDDWDILEKTIMQLNKLGLGYLSLDQKINNLSGGEKTRLYLAKTFTTNADFLILDEPTNNLDVHAREFLYQQIQEWKKGLIVISHDRTLLNLLEHIVEITALGLHSYGGNFNDYTQQKILIDAAQERELFDAKKALTKTQKTIQTTKERNDRKSSHGRKLFLDGKIDRLTANSKRGRSEKTQSRLSKQNEQLINSAEKNLELAKSKIEIIEKIHITLPDTYVPNGKLVLNLDNIDFAFSPTTSLIQQFSLQLTGPERVALIGSNGSGKTTLIKLILGLLQPTKGSIYLGVDKISYLDQHHATLESNLSVLDNFLKLNPEASTQDAHAALASFLFRNTAAMQLICKLSGGEKLRAELACTLLSKHPPQLLILDEPTNHLDLNSIRSIESALENYQGAMLVISHDMAFLEQIGIQKYIYAPFVPSTFEGSS